MTTITATNARKTLYKLMADLSKSHAPIQITGKLGNAMLVSEDDWRAMQETLHLVAIPGMRKSIVKGMKTPVGKCVRKLDW